jgi:hypothetical protein
MMLRASLVLSLLVTALVACAIEEPTQYSRGQAIPIATWSVTVRSTEKLSERMIPDLVRAVKPDAMWLAVHVDLEYEGSDSDEWERDLKRLFSGVRLTVEGGEEHEPIMAPMTDSHLKILKYGSSATIEEMQGWVAVSDWERLVLVFAPPKDSRGLSLLLANYDPRDQQPRLVAVDTGR